MTSPWLVLGIAPGSSVAEVKKAYAQLLRRHRPDQDPVGFRKVRDAYELALRLAEGAIAWSKEEEEEEDDDDEVEDHLDDRGLEAEPGSGHAARAASEPADRGAADDSRDAPPRPRDRGRQWGHTVVAPPRPRELAAALRRALARVRAVPHPSREERLLRLLATLLHRHPGDFALGELAAEELTQEGNLLRRLLPAEVAFAAWSLDALTPARALLLAHLAAGDLASFYRAVDAATAGLEASAEPQQLATANDVARMVALLDPERAERLADLVFQKAPAGMRSTFGDAEDFVQAGRQLRERKLREQLPALVLALFDPRIADDDPRARQALEFTVGAARAPDLAALVAARFPDSWPSYEPRWRRNRANRSKRRAAEPQRKGNWRRLLLLWLVLSILGGIARKCGDDKSPKFRFERRGKDQWSSSTGLRPESPR